tara:strand:+ start:165 stop:782 length:618 start_codon:yes stop_codon:yes gene_type:complete
MNIEVKNSIKPVDYIESMKFLEKRVDEVVLGKKRELLWLLEHKKVFTAGVRHNKAEILDKKIKIIKTNRGGKITLHNSGQKIIYFVLNLNNRKKNIRYLINNIENCIINILKEYEIKSFPDKENIGIWVKNKNKVKKIAAIGIRVKKWVAYHGFSLNVTNDLNDYKKIIPCGVKNRDITNMKSLTAKKTDGIEKIIIDKFLNTFL